MAFARYRATTSWALNIDRLLEGGGGDPYRARPAAIGDLVFAATKKIGKRPAMTVPSPAKNPHVSGNSPSAAFGRTIPYSTVADAQ